VSATILDSLDIDEPDEWEGQSLLSANFIEKPILIFSRSIIYSDGILDGNWKYIYSPREEKEELYDLFADPLEKNNVVNEKKDMSKKYKKLINSWIPYQQEKITGNKEN
jgi:arylsulfatase A-like enzyme